MNNITTNNITTDLQHRIDDATASLRQEAAELAQSPQMIEGLLKQIFDENEAVRYDAAQMLTLLPETTLRNSAAQAPGAMGKAVVTTDATAASDAELIPQRTPYFATVRKALITAFSRETSPEIRFLLLPKLSRFAWDNDWDALMALQAGAESDEDIAVRRCCISALRDVHEKFIPEATRHLTSLHDRWPDDRADILESLSTLNRRSKGVRIQQWIDRLIAPARQPIRTRGQVSGTDRASLEPVRTRGHVSGTASASLETIDTGESEDLTWSHYAAGYLAVNSAQDPFHTWWTAEGNIRAVKLAMEILKDPDTATDIAGNLYLSFLRHYVLGKSVKDLANMLKSATNNACIDHFRKQKRLINGTQTTIDQEADQTRKADIQTYFGDELELKAVIKQLIRIGDAVRVTLQEMIEGQKNELTVLLVLYEVRSRGYAKLQFPPDGNFRVVTVERVSPTYLAREELYNLLESFPLAKVSDPERAEQVTVAWKQWVSQLPESLQGDIHDAFPELAD